MERFVRTAMMCGAVGAAIALASTAQAQSFGCMRLPSTFPQYLGWGYGAGHHAPIVRTPGVRPERVQRMAISPAACGPLGPAPYEMVGCYGGACQGGYEAGAYPAAPMMHAPMGPMMVPVPADQYAPQLQGPVVSEPVAMRPAAGPSMVR